MAEMPKVKTVEKRQNPQKVGWLSLLKKKKSKKKWGDVRSAKGTEKEEPRRWGITRKLCWVIIIEQDWVPCRITKDLIKANLLPN